MFWSSNMRKADSKYRLLICDSHDSYITGHFVEYCYDNKILFLILPLYISYRTQPFDVVVFGPLKQIIVAKLEPLLQTRTVHLNEAEWTGCFVVANAEAFTMKKNQSWVPRYRYLAISAIKTPPSNSYTRARVYQFMHIDTASSHSIFCNYYH